MNKIEGKLIDKAVEEQCRVTAIQFAEYRDRYQMMEKERVKIAEERAGGIIWWIGARDNTIYDQFLIELQNTHLPFKISKHVQPTSALNPNVKLWGRISVVNYEEKWCDVIIWLPEIKKETRRYKFEQLMPI